MLGQRVVMAEEPPLSIVYPDWRSRVEGGTSPKYDKGDLGCDSSSRIVAFGGGWVGVGMMRL